MQWLNENLWGSKGQKIGTVTGSISGAVAGAISGATIASVVPIPIIPQVVGMSIGGKGNLN